MLHTVKQKSRAAMLRRSAISVAIGMCFIGAAWAAEAGGLRIAVTDAAGKPLAGATVKISSPSSLVTKTAVTEADGSVRVAGLDPATDYKVEVVAPGYSTFSATDVVVVSGQNRNLGYALGSNNVQSVVVTSSRLAQVDATSATVGTTLNLAVVESLPTARNYQSYLQLVPGVKPSQGGNPASKSGVNYADIGGATGTSTDNVYILDGIDVTDSNTGTFGSNINSEIIQEQQILTGGIPAEYAGGSGLVSKVITKSGSNEFHGSVNYYFQNDSLVADNKHQPDFGLSTYDAAVTLGGPIIKDKLWFFGSYQRKNRDEDIGTAAGEFLRTVHREDKLGFLKLTWQPTDNDRLMVSFFNDPAEISGSTDETILNNRDSRQVQGGDNYRFDYTKDIGDLRLNAYAFRHEGEVSRYPANQTTRNDVVFFNSSPTIAQRSQGGVGSLLATNRNRDEVGFNAEYFLETPSWGSHTFKAGLSKSENEYVEDSQFTGPESAQYSSIAAQHLGMSFSEFIGPGSTGTRSIVAADIPRVITAINASPDRAYFINLLDTDRNGAVSDAEVRAARFNSVAGNPTGQVNNYRSVQVQSAPYTVKATGKSFYLQDTWTMNRWTVNAGVRAEEWIHYDSTDKKSAEFDWKLAPRLSTVYDLAGDGRSKVWAFIGRYYDPIRTNMSDFAGNLTGPIQEEQIHLGDRWLTFRTRGGPKTPDALFAPSTETPYTDELMLGWATSLGRDYTLSVSYTKRQTRDILEDYDLALYSDPTLTVATAPEGYAAPGSAFYLPYSYFGYSAAPNSNYVIGTLAGGKRDYQGVEVSLTKAKRDNWQGAASYTYNDAKGNTNSDSNADFQGDWLALDPRAPNAYGPQPGNIKHQVKGYGTYFFRNGLELSGVFNWNSGVLYSRTQLISRRNLPMMDAPYAFGGVVDTWISPGSIGSETAPAYYTLDLRLKYQYKFMGKHKVEFFLDVFNILDKQSPISEMGIVGAKVPYAFGEANDWVEPRRFYLGARYSF
ncbi:MAG TPA: TonB-dependent receptor [Telluria sp.]|nr:TonB-dependent receptor [Telluria sp.]